MNKVILVLGMHRSGTSALTRVMSLMGAALPRSVLGVNSGNLRGHWESDVIIAAHDKLLLEHKTDWKDWRRLSLGKEGSLRRKGAVEMFSDILSAEYPDLKGVSVIKEPRICRFAQPYIEGLEAEGADVHSIIMVRHPLEVADSLKTRDGISKLDALYLWLTHMLEAELATRGRSRSFVSYDDFLAAPVKTAKVLENSFTFPLPYKVDEVKTQIQNFVSPDLKRHGRAPEDTVLDPVARGFVSEAFEAMLVLCKNSSSEAALAKIDDIRSSYFGSIDILYSVISEERARLKIVHDAELNSHNAAHEAAFESVKAEQAQAWSARDISHKDAWQKLEAAHKSEMMFTQERHNEQLAAHSKNHNEAWAERDAAHDKIISQLTEEHEKTLSQHFAERENVLSQLKTEQEKALDVTAGHKKMLSQQQSEHERAMSELSAEHENTLSRLSAEHDRHNAALGNKIDDLLAEQRSAEKRTAQDMSFMRDEFGEILRAAEARAERSAAEASALRGDLRAILNSKSWKMTGGLRRLINLLKGVKAQDPRERLGAPDTPPRLEYTSDDGV